MKALESKLVLQQYFFFKRKYYNIFFFSKPLQQIKEGDLRKSYTSVSYEKVREIITEAMIEAVRSLFDGCRVKEDIMSSIKNIHLSHQTFARRVERVVNRV